MSHTRNAPKEIVYCGIKVHYRPIVKDAVVNKINISFREKREQGKRQKLDYGKVLVSCDYRPVTDKMLSANEELPVEVVEATLDKNMASSFFPKLIEKCENFSLPDTSWGLVGPYLLARHQSVMHYAEHTASRQRADMRKMVDLWGKYATSDIVPRTCADDLIEMDKTTAERCIILLRHVFETAASTLTENKQAWNNYKMVGRKRAVYNAQRRINKILNTPVLTEAQCREILDICLLHMKEDVRYIAALLMMLNGIAPEEVCALQYTDIRVSERYPDFCILDVRKTIVEEVSVLTKKERKRAVRHSVLELKDTYQCRWLPVGRLLVNQLLEIKKNADEEDYLLTDTRNIERRLAPDKLEQWLYETFKNVLATSTKNTKVAECLAATAFVNLRKHGLRYEELRYIQGLAPQHMDAQHYVDFAAVIEQSAMAQTQDAWLCALGRDYLSNWSEAENRTIASGRAGYYTRMALTIKVPERTAGVVKLKLLSHFGYNGYIKNELSNNGKGEDT